MNLKDLRLIGKIKAAHGLRGEVFIIFFSKDYSWADHIKTLFVENKEFTVLKANQHKDGLIVKLEGITDRNLSDTLIGQQIYLPTSFFKNKTTDDNRLFLVEIENFKVIDQKLGFVGVISGFSSNTAQDLLLVKSDSGQHYEIPFVDEFVVEINHDDSTLLMDLPEGLLEINS